MLLLVNLVLKRSAQSRGGLAARLHRIHFWLTLAALVAFVASIAPFVAGGIDPRTAWVLFTVSELFLAIFWPLQLFFAASLVAFLIGTPRRRPV